MAKGSDTPIYADVARQLCEEVRTANRGKWLSWRAWRCWGCARFSRTPEARCYAARPGNRGCSQINARFDDRFQPYTPSGLRR